MKYFNFKYLITLLVCVMLIGCATQKKTYINSVQTNTITAYENFIQKYPKSKYAVDVDKRLNVLVDDNTFTSASKANTISAYTTYLQKFPNGKYKNSASQKLEVLQKEKAENDNWNFAKSQNSIDIYESFLQKYPNSKYSLTAKTEIIIMQDSNAWNVAQQKNSQLSYSTYLQEFPYGNYATSAKTKLKIIDEETKILPEWNKVKAQNTYQAYENFYNTDYNSSYASQALEKMHEIEYLDWQKAQRTNTLASYKKYLAQYPDGDYVIEANEALIDKEIDAITAGRHGELPPLQRTDYDYGSTSSVEIENATSYTLRLYYSGTDKKKIEILPQRKQIVVLTNGSYRVAARVNAKNVIPYTGKETLKGGEYSGYYYIKTKIGYY